MNDREMTLERIALLKSELKETQEYFEINYGLSDIENKIIKFLKSNTQKGATYSDLSRNIRAFGGLCRDTRCVLLEKMVASGVLRDEVIPTFSGRGVPRAAYFLLEINKE